MASTVHVHIGLPKTGTSYLQSIFWPQRTALAGHGLLIPGRERRDHLLASMIVREDEAVHRRGPGASDAWQVIRDEVARHEGPALLSHEFFCSASTPQWRRLVEDLAPAEVHLVVTTREPLGLFTSSWQESLKNRSTTPMERYGREESDDPRVIWNWRALDLGLVLERIRPAVPDHRVHVIAPSPPGSPREELWRRFAGVLGVDPDGVRLDGAFANASMGVVEAELLRRVNRRLGSFHTARQRARWIRTVLGDRLLVTTDAERFWPEPDQVEDARRRARRASALLAAGEYDVIGDPALLDVPEDLPERRRPADVTRQELLAASIALNARLLEELRDRVEQAEQPGPAERAGGRRWRPGRRPRA